MPPKKENEANEVGDQAGEPEAGLGSNVDQEGNRPSNPANPSNQRPLRSPNQPTHPGGEASKETQQGNKDRGGSDTKEGDRPVEELDPETRTAENAQKAAFEESEKIGESVQASGEPSFGDFDTSHTRVGNAYGASEKAQLNQLDIVISEAQQSQRDYESSKAQAEQLAEELGVSLDDDLSRSETDAEKDETKQQEEQQKENEKVEKAQLKAQGYPVAGEEGQSEGESQQSSSSSSSSTVQGEEI